MHYAWSHWSLHRVQMGNDLASRGRTELLESILSVSDLFRCSDGQCRRCLLVLVLVLKVFLTECIILLTSRTTCSSGSLSVSSYLCTVLRLVRCRSVWRQCDQCSMTFTAVGTGLLSGQSGACLILGLAVFADKATICVLWFVYIWQSCPCTGS
jgi:hypothetical protein